MMLDSPENVTRAMGSKCCSREEGQVNSAQNDLESMAEPARGK